ncbi:putative Serine aminopeptidase S33 domain-containing protein [Seiridium unicorne]|uniref:Serine aminopeptidase S33 domain-containing protein n=1 Tax=Seiridium unicorne TaxID=138068 RepID=A0ABR2UGU7_9PEZI
MSHGFNCVKDITLPEVAEAFLAHGYNAFLYDARSVGSSDGTPRNLLDPLQIAEDLADIYTYVASLPSVDSRKIVLWGTSFGAVVSACTAAIDRRPRAIVMVCPLFTYVQLHKADKAFSLLIKDRVSQLLGNEPYSLPAFAPNGDNPIGMGGAGGPGGVEAYNLMKRASQSNCFNLSERISLQTYYKLAIWRPKEYMHLIKAPVMMVIPELDDISSPKEQKEAFDKVQSPKRLHWASGKGHLSIVTGEGSPELIQTMIHYLEEVFMGELD